MRTLPLENKPQHLLSFDFDGTLHDPREGSGVRPEFFEALRGIRRQHSALWVINTGRSLPHLLEGMTENRFPFVPDFVVACEREIYELNAVGRYEALGSWNERMHHLHEKLFHEHRKILMQIREWVEQETEAEYISTPMDPAGLIASSEEEMGRICEWMAPILAGAKDLAYEQNSIYLRFSHRDFNKGSCLQHLAVHLGLGAEHCFAMGDGPNDTSMLRREVAVKNACPSNAVERIKQQVLAEGGYLAENQTTRGVIEALEQYFDWEEDEPVVRLIPE